MENPTVNQFLPDKMIDKIDHALGRPIHPFKKTIAIGIAYPTNQTKPNNYENHPIGLNWPIKQIIKPLFAQPTTAVRHSMNI